MGNDKIYFKGLDTLRFLAALAIIIHHIELLKGDLGIGTLWRTKIFTNAGPVSVTFFFVLSGFLITYFLLKEKKAFNSISLQNFYLNRLLRILPAYYFVVILGLFILPGITFFEQPIFSDRLSDHFTIKVLSFFAFLPQLPYILYTTEPIPYLVPLWAVGVEFAFYILWPVLIMGYLKNILKFLGVFTVVFAALPILIRIGFQLFDPPNHEALLLRFFDTMRFSCMSIGGIFASLLFFHKERVLRIVYSLPIQIITVGAFVVLFVSEYNSAIILNHEIYSVLFSIIILNISSNEKYLGTSLPKLKVFDYMGKRSYGIYLFHMIAIQISWKIVQGVFGDSFSGVSNVMLYGLSITIACLFAILSFNLIEQPFLRMKIKTKFDLI